MRNVCIGVCVCVCVCVCEQARLMCMCVNTKTRVYSRYLCCLSKAVRRDIERCCSFVWPTSIHLCTSPHILRQCVPSGAQAFDICIMQCRKKSRSFYAVTLHRITAILVHTRAHTHTHTHTQKMWLVRWTMASRIWRNYRPPVGIVSPSVLVHHAIACMPFARVVTRPL